MTTYRYPVTLGGIIADESVRKPVESMVSDLNRSGVWRRYWTVPLTDVGGGYITYEFDEDTTDDLITTDTWTSATGASVTITPRDGETLIVQASGGATFVSTGLVTQCDLRIYDGTTGYATQSTSLPGLGYAALSCAWVGAVSSPTTFTLQHRLSLGGGSPCESDRRHLAVTAFQQSDASYWVPVHVGRGNAEVLRGAKIVSVYDRPKSNSSYTTVHLSVADATGVERLATYDGQKRGLLANKAFDLNGAELNHRLLDGQVVILEVERAGVPPSLVGVSVEVAIDLIGT